MLSEFVLNKSLDYKYKLSFKNKIESTVMELSDASTLKFTYNVIGKVNKNIQDIKTQIEEINTKIVKNENISLMKFAKHNIFSTMRDMCVDGSDVYFGGFDGILRKVDFSVESNPKTTWTVTLDTINNINGIACDGNYLYVVDRDPKPWNIRTEGSTIGHLYVLNKEDGSIVNSVELSGKGSAITLYGNYAIVSLQIYGFAIYNISNINSIIKVFEHLQTDYNQGEFQKNKVITLGGKPYIFFASFDHGLSVWDISTISTPTKVHKLDLKALNIAEYGGKREQCFDLVKVDNYLYMPIAPMSAYLTDKTYRRGVIRIDLSDLAKMDNDEFEYYPIALEDWALASGESDTTPNAIAHMDSVIAINNARLGLALFKLNDDYSLTYIKSVKVLDGGNIRPMKYTEDGRLIMGSDNSKVSRSRLAEIYRLLFYETI